MLEDIIKFELTKAGLNPSLAKANGVTIFQEQVTYRGKEIGRYVVMFVDDKDWISATFNCNDKRVYSIRFSMLEYKRQLSDGITTFKREVKRNKKVIKCRSRPNFKK